jgi:hypothetical protein
MFSSLKISFFYFRLMSFNYLFVSFKLFSIGGLKIFENNFKKLNFINILLLLLHFEPSQIQSVSHLHVLDLQTKPNDVAQANVAEHDAP